MKRLALAGVLFILWTVLCAHSEPPLLVLHRLANKTDDWSTLRVTVQHRLIEDGREVQPLNVELHRPGEIRLGTGGVVTPLDKLSPGARVALELILYSGDKAQLAARLTQWGVNVEEQSLGLWRKTPCFILGAAYEGEARPQLWVERFEHVPVRLLFGITENGQVVTWEILFGDWSSPVADGLFPQTLSLYKNGKLFETWELQKASKG